MKHRLLLTLGLITLFIFVSAFQGSRGIYSPDEGYYVSIAQEMVETGSYLIPSLHHVPWLDKPPLSIWGIAIGLKMFGMNEWGARTFHGLCLIVTTILVFLLGRSAGNTKEGLWGALIFVTMLMPFVAGNVVTPDLPLTFWTTATFFFFWKSMETEKGNGTLWKLLMSTALGLGFLTKGPAVLLPLSSIFLFLLFNRKVKQYLISTWIIPGFILFCIFGLGWYIYVAKMVPGSLEYFWDNQVIGRTISDKYGRNSDFFGFLIYIPVIIFGALPWSVFWPEALIQWWKNSPRNPIQRNSFSFFLILWITTYLLMLSIIRSRLPLYALPVFPPLALVTARSIPWINRENLNQSRLLGFSPKVAAAMAVWILILAGLKLAASYYPMKENMRILHEDIAAHLPHETHEIVAVDEHLEALGFYSGLHIEQVTTQKNPYPFFVLPEHLDEEINEMEHTDYAHVFLCRKVKNADMMRIKFMNSSISFKEIALPFKRYMFICDPRPGSNSICSEMRISFPPGERL